MAAKKTPTKTTTTRAKPAARAKPRAASATSERPTHVALFRAMNVGGNMVKMADLTRIFERSGARAVRTIIASGNVLFTADDVPACLARVSAGIAKLLGRELAIMVRSLDEVRALVAAQPYKAPMPPAGVTWYVCFLDKAPSPAPKLPLRVPTGDVTYVALVGRELCGTVTPLPGKTTVENFKPEALFKVGATVRNWNTVLKLIAEKP